MANEDIKRNIKNANIKFWQVANEYGVTDGNFSRKLRKELAENEKQKILKIISEIKRGERDGNF